MTEEGLDQEFNSLDAQREAAEAYNRDLRGLVADLLNVTTEQYTASQTTYDLPPPRSNRYFVTPYGWKVARLISRLEARVFRPAMAMFTATDAMLPFPLRQVLDRVDSQLDLLIYQPR
jgi:hypothetical protein